MLNYLRTLSPPRLILWCYLVWWFGVAIPYFQSDLGLWFSSCGIAVIIGTGLYLSTAYASAQVTRLGRWAIVRLYLMPFFVSSFAALIKDQGFFLVFHPTWSGNLIPLLACAWLVGCVLLARVTAPGMRRGQARGAGAQDGSDYLGASCGQK